MHETFDINDVDAILKRVLQSPTEQINFISDGRTMKVMSEDRSIDVDAINMFDYYTKEKGDVRCRNIKFLLMAQVLKRAILPA